MPGSTPPALYGLLGHPLGHSLSPQIHEAALRALRLTGTYLALPVPPARLAGAIAGVRAWRLPGLNVTIPHKVAILDLVDIVTPLARSIGAANTLYWLDDKLIADNTDHAGFLASLPAVDFAGAEVAVLGAGGAARAVVLALVSLGVGRIHLVARREAAARALLDELVPAAMHGLVADLDDLADLEVGLATSRLVVNATPLGTHGHGLPLHADVIAALPDGAWVIDLVYNPAETPLLRKARARGLNVLNGREMLVQQAAASFQRWTGVAPPLDVMRAALEGAAAAPVEVTPCDS